MCSSNGAHRVRRWLIVEKDAAASIDLQIDEAGGEHHSRRQNFSLPVTRTLITWRNTLNHPTIDYDDRFIMPSISIKDTVSRNCQLGSSRVVGRSRTHRPTSLLPIAGR